MIKKYNETVFGDIIVTWWTDDDDHIGMTMTPLSMKDKGVFCSDNIESLVQIHARGDHLPNGYGNGLTLATTSATDRMHLVGQTSDEHCVITILEDDTGRRVEHRLSSDEDTEALRASCRFENRGDKPVTLNLLSSLNLSGITPFTEGDACNELLLHRACSFWSGEGRLKTETIEEVMLERSWTGHALRIVKFGQVGSMPVRGYFPFAAIEDKANDVTWAVQLACPSSWQIEIRRKDDKLNMMASLADEDFGHWAKTIGPGESFT
nr:alpha-galactosidase [Lachnospiraceae bacterium]